MSKKVKLLISTGAFLFPLLTMAEEAGAGGGGLGKLTESANSILGTVKLLPTIAFYLALAYFFYGLASYTMGVDDKTKAAAKTTMIYGVIIIFVISSIGGIVALLGSSTGVGGGTLTAPSIK